MKRVTNKRTNGGFTLLELMVVVAIVGILAAHAVYSGTKQVKKASRTEVTVALDKIREAQFLYYAEHDDYATSWNDLLFRTDHGQLVSDQVYKGKLYQYTLSNPWGPDSYYVSAMGNLDGDDFLDSWALEAGRPGQPDLGPERVLSYLRYDDVHNQNYPGPEGGAPAVPPAPPEESPPEKEEDAQKKKEEDAQKKEDAKKKKEEDAKKKKEEAAKKKKKEEDAKKKKEEAAKKKKAAKKKRGGKK